MGLVPWRVFGFVLGGLVLALFILGPLRWEPNPRICHAGYGLSMSGWETLWVVGHVEIRYRPVHRSCANYEVDPRLLPKQEP